MNGRPNILVIMTDQHRFDALSCRRNPFVRTPHLDSLIERSVDFSAAYTQSPVCAPSRYSLATGNYVAEHGVVFNGHAPVGPVRTIAHGMRDVGYRCFQVGHMHWSPETTDTGFEPNVDRRMWLDSLPQAYRERFHAEHESSIVRTTMAGPSPLPEAAFWGPYVAERTCACIDAALDSGESFFAWSSIYEPHPPFFPPASIYSEKKDLPYELTAYRDGPVAPEDRQLKRRQKWAHLTDLELRQMMAGYYGMVEVADRSVGRILNHLERLGILENTWIVWTSDHGEQLYDHGLFLKFCMYEQSVHVPFCISGPGVEPQKCEHLIEHIDLMPTLFEIAGIEAAVSCRGRSLCPFFKAGLDQPEDWRKQVYSQINDLCMVRSSDWKLIMRKGEPVELYNVKTDPEERKNLLREENCTGILKTLIDVARKDKAI